MTQQCEECGCGGAHIDIANFAQDIHIFRGKLVCVAPGSGCGNIRAEVILAADHIT
jgi:hypothetical protein